jgi:hypothetical protein
MITYVLLGEALDLAKVLARPIAELLPASWTEEAQLPNLFAIMLILIVSFLFGPAMRTSWGAGLIDKAERRLLEKLRGYSAVRRLSRTFLGDDIEDQFEPGLFRLPN